MNYSPVPKYPSALNNKINPYSYISLIKSFNQKFEEEIFKILQNKEKITCP